MNDFYIAAIDLDDTLLGNDGTISAYTLEQLTQWQAAGREIVIATGRPPRSIGASLPPTLQDIPRICYNGAEIHINDACVYQHWLPAEETADIVTDILADNPNASVGLEVDGELYLNRRVERAIPYQVADLLNINKPAAKILIFDEAKEPLAPLQFALPSGAKALYSTRYPHFIQIMATNCNKATALRHFTKEHGHRIADVVAFGDDTNDVEMIEASGLGVAMGNAVDEVKAVADRITGTNEEDGVAQVLASLLT